LYALCRRPKTAVYTASLHVQCTWPVYTAENGRAHGRAHGPYTTVYTSRYGPYATVYTTRYTVVYGRVDGRFRPCTWPVHGRRHVDSCTRPYTCRVHGRVHGPYTAVYMCCVRGRVRAMYTAEDVRADGPYTFMYTCGVDGPCARPIHGRVRAVYTARPLYGRVRAVFAGEDVFTGPVHGRRVTGTRHVTRLCTRPCTRHVTRPCTRPVRGHTTLFYTAVDGPYTAV